MFYFFIKFSIPILVAFLLTECIGYSQLLSPGDVVVVGYNFKDPDEFALLSLVDLSPGTVLYVTDCGWDGIAHAFRSGEGLISYTVPASGIPAGQQIHYPVDPGFVTQGVSGFFGLSQAGDQLLIFQGSWQTPQFIFGLSDDDGFWKEGTSVTLGNQHSFLPDGLIDGQTALALNQYINARFECAFSFSNREEFLRRLCDPTHWVKSTDRVMLPILGCGFDILAVPVTWTVEWQGNDTWVFCCAQKNVGEVRWEYWDKEEFKTLECSSSGCCYNCQIPLVDNERWLIRSCIEGRCERGKSVSRIKGEEVHYLLRDTDGTIGLSFPHPEDIERYTVYNVQGQVVIQSHRPHQSLVWFEGLIPGIYVLTIEQKTNVKSMPFVR